MRIVFINSLIIGLLLQLITTRVNAHGGRIVISNDGPVILGGKIKIKAELYYSNGRRPTGEFWYSWADNALAIHTYETTTTNTTSYWTMTYPAHDNKPGPYRIEVTVKQKDLLIFWPVFGRNVTEIEVTDLLNGNIAIKQSNKTLEDEYVSSQTEAAIDVSLRKGDYDYIASKATSIATFWFVDCKYYGQSPDFTFNYNFTQPESTHVIEALVIASLDPPTTTTVAPTTTTSASTTLNPNSTTVIPITTSTKPNTTSPAPQMNTNETSNPLGNHTFPFVCLNSSVVSPEPHKIYGYFTKEVKVRAPISNISVDGTHWLQPWELLSLNVSCRGSGPFEKCLLFHRGQYNVTGNETCDDGDNLESCNFSITHYFLDPGVYTIVVILNNYVSKQIYPLTINIYTVTPKAQLSVIIVPVSCSLAAVVLIVFGVAYYIQSRARFTVEVANFDFGQHNPEMEYKTFTERLRDSFNNALRPGGDRISGYEPLNKPLLN